MLWPLYLPRKSPIPTEEKAGWAPQPVWTLWRREKCLAPPRNRTLPIVNCHIKLSQHNYQYPLMEDEMGRARNMHMAAKKQIQSFGRKETSMKT
jgi:hypothetical protein